MLEKDAADGVITPDEVRVKPKAMMNAIYLGGRSELTIVDRLNFCRLWVPWEKFRRDD